MLTQYAKICKNNYAKLCTKYAKYVDMQNM